MGPWWISLAESTVIFRNFSWSYIAYIFDRAKGCMKTFSGDVHFRFSRNKQKAIPKFKRPFRAKKLSSNEPGISINNARWNFTSSSKSATSCWNVLDFSSFVWLSAARSTDRNFCCNCCENLSFSHWADETTGWDIWCRNNCVGQPRVWFTMAQSTKRWCENDTCPKRTIAWSIWDVISFMKN